MADGNVARPVRRGSQADPSKLRNDAIDAVGFRVDGDIALRAASAIQRSKTASSITVSYFDRSTSICSAGARFRRLLVH
jgi:hypothetical protein